MDFSNSTTSIGLIQEVDRICGTTDNTFTLKAKTARINAAMDRFFTLAFEGDSRWNFDDFNHTTPPIETQNIVSGTNRYQIGSFTSNIIKIIRIEVLNADGNGVYLQPETFEMLDNHSRQAGAESGRIGGIYTDTFQELYVDAPSGTPTHYIKYGDFIYLRPNPDYSETAGLLAYVNRPADYFVSTDTTQDPGIPSIFHTYIARYAALQFLIEKNLPAANGISALVAQDEDSIRDYFGRRDKDVLRRVYPNVEDTR